MGDVWFTICHRFGPGWQEREGPDGWQDFSWSRYLGWSGLAQLEEVVGLDGVLCEPVVPPISEDLTIEDWDHVVSQDYRLHFYHHLDYLLGRIELQPGFQVLAAMVDPPEDGAPVFDDERFEFVGYELLDVHGDISALTNCGGFPLAFDNSELNRFGLIDDPGRAYRVKGALRESYPEHSHAACDVWAVWRMRLRS